MIATVIIPKDGKEVLEFTANGKVIWKKGEFTNKEAKIKGLTSDDEFISFEVESGDCHISAIQK